MDNILALHKDLVNRTYKHGGYQEFKINDPKPRDIHKATVRDRLVHHLLYRALYTYFDRSRKSRFSTSNELLKVASRWVKFDENYFEDSIKRTNQNEVKE